MTKHLAAAVILLFGMLAVSTPGWCTPTRSSDCSNCHGTGPGVYALGVSAVPSKTLVPVSGAFSVSITLTNVTSGSEGFRIKNPDGTWGISSTITDTTSFTANLTAPATTGSKTYTVYAVSGPDDSTGRAGMTTFTINVIGTPGTVTKRWNFATGAAINASASSDGTNAYIANDTGNVDAILAATGSRPPGVWSTGYSAGAAIKSRVVYYNGKLYFGSGNRIVAVDAATKTPIAQSPVLATTQIVSTPAVSSSAVYVGSDNGSLYKLDPNTLAILATRSLGGGSVSSSPAIFGSTCLVGDAAGNLNMLMPTDLTVRFSTPILGQTAINGSPCVDMISGKGYVATASGKLWCFNTSNGQVSSVATGWAVNPVAVNGPVSSSPFVSPNAGVVSFGTDNGWIYTVREDTGAVLPGWPVRLGTAAFSSPPVVVRSISNPADYIVYAGGLDNKLYALPVSNPAAYSVYDASPDGGAAVGFAGGPAVTGVSAADSLVIGNRNGYFYGFVLK